MPARQAFDWGTLAGMLFMLGAYGVHWMITPMSHPRAGPLETWSAVTQIVLGFGAGIYLYASRRPRVGHHEGPAML